MKMTMKAFAPKLQDLPFSNYFTLLSWNKLVHFGARLQMFEDVDVHTGGCQHFT